jgi:hypothetical protein
MTCRCVWVGPLNFDFEKLAHPSLTDIKKLLYEEIARFNAKQAEAGQAPVLEQTEATPEDSCPTPAGSPSKKRRIGDAEPPQ